MIATSFKEAIVEMMEEIAKHIPDAHKQSPVKAYLTGGGAVHYYCNARVSDDIDLIMPYAVKIPEDLFVVWLNGEGLLEQGHNDYTYNSTFGLLHEEYEDRAVKMISIEDKFEIYLLSPEDLIITKIIRFAENDENDIRNIIEKGSVDKHKLFELADDTIRVGVGFQEKTVRTNLELVMAMFLD